MSAETNAARAAEIARSVRVLRDTLRGYDEPKLVTAITAALDEAEARGRAAVLKEAAGEAWVQAKQGATAWQIRDAVLSLKDTPSPAAQPAKGES